MKRIKGWKLVVLSVTVFVGVAWASTKMRDLVITSSTLDSSPVGLSVPSTGNFTTLKLNNAASLGHELIGNGTSYVDVVSTQINCLTTSCAGGSTYAASTTYTNGANYSVLEEVTMQAGSPAATGCDFQLTPTINGVQGPVASITNDANSRMQSSTFRVPPAGTFSVVVAQVGGGSCGTPSIAGWLEVGP